MDRRQFIQAVGAASALAVHPPIAVASPKAGGPGPSHVLTPAINTAPRTALTQLENQHLSVVIFSDASAKIVDRNNGAEWRMGPVALQEESEVDLGHCWLRSERSICEQYPGRFRGQKEGQNIRFWVLDNEGHARGSFLVNAALDGAWLDFKLLEVDEQLPGLSFPPPIESESLVLPMHLGRWIQKPLNGRFFYTFFSHLNMRWFGGLNRDNGWLAVFPEPNFADSGVMASKMSAAPAWLKQLGKWSERRSVRYRFLRGGYVNLALAFREWAIEKGIHRSLTSKLASTPALASLTQGRIVSLVEATPRHGVGYDQDVLDRSQGDAMLGSGPRIMLDHQQTLQCIRSLREAGVERALVVVRGWIPGGYDYSHPDVWPPEALLGSRAAFKELCQSEEAFPVALHDNYQDIYFQSQSWPHGVVRRRNGERMAGGYWAGGQAYILTAQDGLAYAKRNWDVLNTLQLRAIFVDTTTAVQMYESYDAARPLTRSQDLAAKIEMLQFFKSKGVVLGSEEGADFAVPYVDWTENRHTRLAGESVPLWPLVFHDAVVGSRYTGYDSGADWAGGPSGAQAYPAWLEDMLWGYAAMSHIQDFEHRQAALQRMAKLKQVDAWFRQISSAAMVDHRFLTRDYSLEETRFSCGKRILVNFAHEPQSHQGIDVPAYGYSIQDLPS